MVILVNKNKNEPVQPQVPLRLPCYDFTGVTKLALVLKLQSGKINPNFTKKNKDKNFKRDLRFSDQPDFPGVTGGVYKAQEHIHRGMLIHDY